VDRKQPNHPVYSISSCYSVVLISVYRGTMSGSKWYSTDLSSLKDSFRQKAIIPDWAHRNVFQKLLRTISGRISENTLLISLDLVIYGESSRKERDLITFTMWQYGLHNSRENNPSYTLTPLFALILRKSFIHSFIHSTWGVIRLLPFQEIRWYALAWGQVKWLSRHHFGSFLSASCLILIS